MIVFIAAMVAPALVFFGLTAWLNAIAETNAHKKRCETLENLAQSKCAWCQQTFGMEAVLRTEQNYEESQKNYCVLHEEEGESGSRYTELSWPIECPACHRISYFHEDTGEISTSVIPGLVLIDNN